MNVTCISIIVKFVSNSDKNNLILLGILLPYLWMQVSSAMCRSGSKTLSTGQDAESPCTSVSITSMFTKCFVFCLMFRVGILLWNNENLTIGPSFLGLPITQNLKISIGSTPILSEMIKYTTSNAYLSFNTKISFSTNISIKILWGEEID